MFRHELTAAGSAGGPSPGFPGPSPGWIAGGREREEAAGADDTSLRLDVVAAGDNQADPRRRTA